MTSITFVNVSHPSEIQNHNVQTSIRRHVMREIGRSRRKRARPKIIPLEVQIRTQDHESAEQSECALESCDSSFQIYDHGLYRNPRGSGILGIDLDEEALQVVQFSKSFLPFAYRSPRSLSSHFSEFMDWSVISFSSDSPIRLPVPAFQCYLDTNRSFRPHGFPTFTCWRPAIQRQVQWQAICRLQWQWEICKVLLQSARAIIWSLERPTRVPEARSCRYSPRVHLSRCSFSIFPTVKASGHDTKN